MSDYKISSGRATLAFLLGTLFFAYAFMQRVAPSVMTDEIMIDFSVGGAAVGALSGWYFYTYALMQLPVGILTDRFGPRKLMAVALMICALASFMMAQSDSLYMASLSRAVIGATVGFGFVGTLAIAGYFFPPAKYAFLAGVLQGVGMLGAILGQAPLRLVVESVGWRGMVSGLAVVAFVLSILVFFLIPRRPQKSGKSDKNAGSISGLIAVLRKPQSWICAVIGFGLPAIMLGFASLWAVPWLHSVHGFTRSEAAGLASLLFLGWALSAPLVGWLSDYMGRRKPLIWIGNVSSIAIFALIVFSGISSPVSLSILFILCGVAGSCMTAMFSVIRELNSEQFSSTSLGLLNMCIVGSGAIMQPLVGWLLDLNWQGKLEGGVRIYSPETYELAFLAMLLANVLSLICLYFLKETYCKPLDA